MDKRTSTNGPLLLKCLIGILFAGSAAGSKQCEVKGVNATADEANSTFVYNIIYEDPSCTNKGKPRARLTICNGISPNYETGGEGMVHNCYNEGMWMVTVSQNEGSAGTVNSNCFHCLGFFMSYIVNLVFDFEALKATVQNIHPGVDNWTLTTYMTTIKSDYFPCSKYTSVEEIQNTFEKTHLQPQHIIRTRITMRHAFDPQACYCFVMSPISHLDLSPRNFPFTTKNCQPQPVSSENGVSPIDDLPMSIWETVQLLALLGILIGIVVMMLVIHCNPQFLSKILGLKRRLAGNESPSEKLMVSRNSDVLLLYAPDISGSEHLAKFKNKLQAAFKVYDLFDGNDPNRLADPCGWIEKMLLPSSGVKLLLVESVGLLYQINSLLKSYPENSGLAKVTQKSLQDKTTESLLTFSLRTIICTNLRQDYSTVFVVRFSDEVRDVVDLLVQMRRYKFPDHFSKLSEAMKEAKRSNEGKEVV